MTARRAWIWALGIVALVVTVEMTLGRRFMCACGTVKAWHGVVYSSENSQHLTDWYTFSHVLHGVVFYGLLWFVGRRSTLAARLLAAVAIEGVWEMVENSPFIIDRYRTATIALDYYGDSVINSVSDIVAMVAGFWVARHLAVWTVVGLALATEVVLALLIRDNLTLNIIMLVWPVEGIKAWQSGG